MRASGLEPNPYRAGFLQLVVVGESACASGERLLTYTAATFTTESLHIAPEFFAEPGYMDFRSLDNTYRKGYMDRITSVTEDMKEWTYQAFIR